MEKAKECLEYLVSNIVENKEAIRIDVKNDERGVLLELYVAEEDMGRVIGKKGKTADSMRTLIRTIGAREKVSVSLMIIEPEGSAKFKKPEVAVQNNDTSKDSSNYESASEGL